MKKLLFPILLVAMIFASCSDDNGLSIEITSPSDGQTYAAGETIDMRLKATDDVGVTNINVTINSDNTPSQSQDLELAGISDLTDFVFTINYFLDPLTPAGEFDITVVASDADGNSAEDSIKINVQ